MKDPYRVLGVPPTAPLEEIGRAFRRMALKYHPDRNDSPDASIRIKEIYEAYGVLKDTASRAEYDNKEYERQRFQARTKAKQDLAAVSRQGYDKAFSDNVDVVKDLNKRIAELKEESVGISMDLKELLDYGNKAKHKKQGLREKMRNMW
tara:strand:+ start:44 stop:490 length:447 start_codon:yes stop_codon:yes gene_type:complete